MNDFTKSLLASAAGGVASFLVGKALMPRETSEPVDQLPPDYFDQLEEEA
jgi:hypothetical protein